MAASASKPDLHVANMLRLAIGDLDAFLLLASAQNRNDAYHLDQAAEKLLLALLTCEGIHAERKDSHRLDVLRDKLPLANPFRQRFDGLTYLTQFATTYRYPKDGGRLPQRPDPRGLKEDAGKIQSMIQDAADYFAVDLQGSDTEPAGRVDPPRASPRPQ